MPAAGARECGIERPPILPMNVHEPPRDGRADRRAGQRDGGPSRLRVCSRILPGALPPRSDGARLRSRLIDSDHGRGRCYAYVGIHRTGHDRRVNGVVSHQLRATFLVEDRSRERSRRRKIAHAILPLAIVVRAAAEGHAVELDELAADRQFVTPRDHTRVAGSLTTTWRSERSGRQLGCLAPRHRRGHLRVSVRRGDRYRGRGVLGHAGNLRPQSTARHSRQFTFVRPSLNETPSLTARCPAWPSGSCRSIA